MVDGYIGMQGLGPSGGEPVKSNFAVASFDAMGADVLACKLMGIDAEDVPHIKIISERNKLPIRVNDYIVISEGYEKYKS